MLPLSVYPPVQLVIRLLPLYMLSLVTFVLVVAVIVTFFFTCTLALLNFTLFRVTGSAAPSTSTSNEADSMQPAELEIWQRYCHPFMFAVAVNSYTS